ncbi:hypothetical protein GQ55_3G445100 [Panicum hallii var. hallii]|uniref:Uncharacterized protein n=1 Tax=Panicum hallii var. hallii TaxID=1504633 RepID=A0A2T7EI98_9POAL|nr:hypothetical protein GQ55_3G445100 [Panicum hallii var. hallii]
MSVAVSKSSPVVVRPSEPATTSSTTIKLSSFDKGLERMPTAALLVFEHPIHETTETIKRALSQALVHYYPFAGRMVAGADGDDAGHIECSGEGAVFVAASASCAVEEVIASDHSPASRALRNDLAVCYPGESCGPADPLLLVQVTEFSCGGFVLGVTWNHAVADGAGMVQFLKAIGELARGLPSPSVAPVRRDDSLPSLPAVVPIDKLLSLEPFDDLVYLDFTVPSSAIGRIRADFGSRFGGHPCSVFDAVSAVVWRCRTRAVMSDPEAPAALFFSANARRHVGAKQGYYGNCVTAQLVTEKSGTVAGGDVVELAKKIRDAKETIADQFNDAEGGGPRRAATRPVLQDRYDMVIVSSWQNLGFDEVDLGSGRPARVTSRMRERLHFPALGMLPPCKGRDGANVLSVVVKEKHADAFLGELARFIDVINAV